MTLYDFLDFCIDAGLLNVEIYSLSKEDIVWSGYGDEVPDDVLYKEIYSFDVPVRDGSMTFNIE